MGRGGDTVYNGLYGEAPLFRLQVYERIGISIVEACERVGKPVISVGKKVQKGKKRHFMAEKKSRKRSGFVIHSYFKDSTFSAVKRVAKR